MIWLDDECHDLNVSEEPSEAAVAARIAARSALLTAAIAATAALVGALGATALTSRAAERTAAVQAEQEVSAELRTLRRQTYLAAARATNDFERQVSEMVAQLASHTSPSMPEYDALIAARKAVLQRLDELLVVGSDDVVAAATNLYQVVDSVVPGLKDIRNSEANFDIFIREVTDADSALINSAGALRVKIRRELRLDAS